MGAVRFCLALALTAAVVEAWGRGEFWLPKPPVPPSLESLSNESRYVEWKWRTDVTDPATGVDIATTKSNIVEVARRLSPREPWNVVKATCFAWELDNVAIDLSPLDWFPAFALWDRIEKPMCAVISERERFVEKRYYPEIIPRIVAGNESGRWRVWMDFDHIIPEWDVVIKLGFAGMHKRLLEHYRDDVSYYRAEKMSAEAIDRMLDRLIAQGEKRLKASRVARLEKEVASLRRLRVGPPETAYDCLQFIYLYFVISEHFDGVQARSLSVIDQTLWPYYQRDLAAGRTTESEFREQFRHWLWQWGSIDNYWGQPITVGGTAADGTSAINPLSYVILDVMDECALPSPKFHLKIADNTPDDFLLKALDMARRHRSLSFMGEKPCRAALESRGYPADEARRFVTKGCYAICTPEAGNELCTGHQNLPKIVEEMLREPGYPTFAAFKTEYMRRVAAVCAEVRGFVEIYERHVDDVNPALLASLAGTWSVKTGKDAMANGTRTGNDSGILLSGLGTAVDALLAVKEIVYERKELTYAELGDLMTKNWEGREDLRLRMLRSKRKWGTNDPEANRIGREIADAASSEINGRPNTRGGYFRMSGHNSRQFVWQGELTGATPDGRRKGDEISKNLSPAVGADTEGATAVVETLAVLDSKMFGSDFPLDVALLPGSVQGEKGLKAMKALLFRYFDNGGFMMQFNVFDPAELRDAQAHPERYQNLQVRVCGWNVRWNDLSRKEQDAYIRRAESLAQ